MIRTKRSEQSKLISGINITPFTDICLVLLIIFMVTASAFAKRESGYNIMLPQASKTDAPPLSPIIVSIEEGQRIFVGKDEVTFETFATAISTYQPDQDGKLKMILRADESVPYSFVIKTIDIAGQAGISDTLLATRSPEQPSLPVQPSQ